MFTKVSNSVLLSVVEDESYWNETDKIIKVVCGSTMTGVTDATL